MRALAGVLAAALLGCGAPPTGELTLELDVGGPTRPISPHVYGVHGLEHARPGAPFTLLRFGGTRTSTYNWENNASNAGHDPPVGQNDDYLHPTEEPAGAALAVLGGAARLSASGHPGAAVITVPLIGHVARDRRSDGDVGRAPDYLRTRFVPSVARCAEDTPRLDDDRVCQHAFVRRVAQEAARLGVTVYFALDNEPGGWPVTHPLLRAERPVTYAELFETSVAHARMIREEAPRARVLGPVSFGWPDLTHLAGAADAQERDLLETYLATLRAEGDLLDLMDVHWYPDLRVGEVSVASAGDAPALAALRVEAPRSLWDPRYVEPSWIAQDELDGQPVRLLSRLRARAEARSPGVGIAITEWSYGGGAHPSGAVAVADALGAFGRHGVEVAAYWPLYDQRHDYALAAFRMYRRIDGEVSFGDRSIATRSSDDARATAWASLDASEQLVAVLVHRDALPARARLALRGGAGRRCRVFVLDADAPRSREKPAVTVPGVVRLTPRSVTTLICPR